MIASERSEFLGTHVTAEVKAEVARQAAEHGLSMSRFVYHLIKHTLKVADSGIDLAVPRRQGKRQ